MQDEWSEGMKKNEEGMDDELRQGMENEWKWMKMNEDMEWRHGRNNKEWDEENTEKERKRNKDAKEGKEGNV